MSINLLISAVILGFCLYVFFLTHDWKGKRKKREKAIANLAELYRQYRERVAEQSAPAPREDKPAPVLKTRDCGVLRQAHRTPRRYAEAERFFDCSAPIAGNPR